MKLTKTGIAIFTAALMVTTSALAEEAKREGVIIAHTNDGLNLRTREGPLHVVMAPDTKSREVEVPADLAAALARRARAKRQFAALPPSHRKAFVEWITSAKREETRRGRVAKSVERLEAGGKFWD